MAEALEKLTRLYLNQLDSSPHVTARLAGIIATSLESGERITDFRYEALEQILQACQRHLFREMKTSEYKVKVNESSFNS